MHGNGLALEWDHFLHPAGPQPSTQDSRDVNGSYPDSLEGIMDNESTLATNEKMNLEEER